ncbi:Ankyrin repeat family protein [Euphorbia peplus]|nr:Ankyrin repeat family protein [Euphorbia peplus]
MEDGDYVRHLSLLKASLNGDWITANRYFQEDPALLTTSLSDNKEIALHAAISSSCTCSDDFIRKLVEIMPVDSLALPNMYGFNALHYAAIVGHTNAAKILIEKNPSLTLSRSDGGFTPVRLASENAKDEKTVMYLLSVTPDEHPSPFDGLEGAELLCLLILREFYGLAIDLVKRKPMLASVENSHGVTALEILAQKSMAFSDGIGFGWFKQLLIQYLFETHTESNGRKFGFLQDVHNTIIMKKQAKELLTLLISEAYGANPSIAHLIRAKATLTAARYGTHEIVRESIKSDPNIVYCADTLEHSFVHTAILYRHENVFNLLHQLGVFSNLITSSVDKFGDNMLHLAGKLVPSKKISGAALQMQRELQWFKEVEKFVLPSFKGALNKEGKTPRMVFTEEHKDLLEKGEKWMKDTASSCATVAALMLLLCILTSRCAEEDFLRALPMRMSIGLIALFCSIAFMLASFCAAFYLVMFERVTWIAVLIAVVAGVPVVLFALLQFPLLVEITYSTFRPSIFGKEHQKFMF